MADFNKAYNRTLGNEGGYSNNVNDRGGETIYGIARKMHPDWDGWSIVDSYRHEKSFPRILYGIESLIASVKIFYKKYFWDIIRGDEILIQDIAESIYDSAVNMGNSEAIKLAQRSLRISETGKMDNETLAKLNNKS